MSNSRKIVESLAERKEIFIGLEDSKTTWKICVRCERQVIHETSMPARYDAFRAFLDKRFKDCRIHVVYEAGFKGFNLYFDLVNDGYDCVVVPPHTVHQAKCSRTKNDRIDARLLAKNLEDGNCKSCHVPDKGRLEDRQTVRSLNIVNKEIKRIKVQIRGFLYCHGIDPGIRALTWTNNHYRFLRHLELSPKLRKLLDLHLAQLEFSLSQQKELEGMLRDLSKEERYAPSVKIARSLPGIGPLTSIRLVLELGEDFHRFRSGGEIASFVGLGGTEYSTGGTERRGGITKQGNGMIRAWLIESSWIAIRHDAALYKFYSRIKQNAGNSKKAIVAVARKLIIRLRSCMISNTEYIFDVIRY